jgi:hypothetical protein
VRFSRKKYIFALMNTTIRHIEYLVSTQSCVVIPGLGAILAHKQSAQISADAMSIIPPHRVYTFNGSLTQTDGLVERSIARSLDVTYERAAAIVASDVDTMRHQLAADHSVSLGRVGTLEQDAEGNVQFNAFSADALTPAANWLQPLNLSNAASAIGEKSESSEIEGVRRLSPITRFVRVASAAVVLAFIGFASSTPITIEDANYASVALPDVKVPTHQSQFVPSTATPQLDIIDNGAAFAEPVDTAARTAYQRMQKRADAAEVAAPIAVAQATPAPQKVQAVARMNDGDAYCIIVASVNNTDEANTYIAEAKQKYNEDCALLNIDGRYRIYIATAPSAAAAHTAIANGVAKRHPGAWVCARR